MGYSQQEQTGLELIDLHEDVENALIGSVDVVDAEI